MKSRLTILESPALPAAWLLFGMIFGFAAAFFVDMNWTRSATIVYFVLPLLWVGFICLKMRHSPFVLSLVDKLVVVFLIIVCLRLFTGSDAGISEAAKHYARFLPFMVIAPYICGRLMRRTDIALLLKITIYSGLLLILLLVLERMITVIPQETGRWLYFGQNHSPLLGGSLLALALIALAANLLFAPASRKYTVFGTSPYTVIVLLAGVTIFLVSLGARGWLLLVLMTLPGVAFSLKKEEIWKSASLCSFVFLIAVSSFYGLKHFDTSFTRQYDVSIALHEFQKGSSDAAAGNPILGADSCKPWTEGQNSVAMRWVMYNEAFAIFRSNPLFGVGSAGYGSYSCTGELGFPHSTILQSFAELGLVGGVVLVSIFALSGLTVLRSMLAHDNDFRDLERFASGLLIIFLVGDQLYGNYFLSLGGWFSIGLVAGIAAEKRLGYDGN